MLYGRYSQPWLHIRITWGASEHPNLHQITKTEPSEWDSCICIFKGSQVTAICSQGWTNYCFPYIISMFSRLSWWQLSSGILYKNNNHKNKTRSWAPKSLPQNFQGRGLGSCSFNKYSRWCSSLRNFSLRKLPGVILITGQSFTYVLLYTINLTAEWVRTLRGRRVTTLTQGHTEREFEPSSLISEPTS